MIGSDGLPLPARVRKRFPYLGLVPLGYAVGGTLACALVSWVIQVLGLSHWLPTRVLNAPLAPAPSWENLLFGAGPAETAFAWGLVGYRLWVSLWRTRVPVQAQSRGFAGVFPHLVLPALAYGALTVVAVLPLSTIGLYLRTAPAAQPWVVRPFFALLAAPVLSLQALITGIIPLVLLALGLSLGLLTAVVAAAVWRQFPEEPIR